VEKNGWIAAFLVVITVEIVLQTLILAGAYYGLRQASRTLHRLIDESQRKVDLILFRVARVLDKSHDKISNTAEIVAEVTRLAREHAQTIDQIVSEVLDRVRLEIIRLDATLTIAVETVEKLGFRMRRSVLGPLLEALARSTGICSGIDFSRSGNVPGVEPPRHEDPRISQFAGVELFSESPMQNDLNLTKVHLVSSQDKESWSEPRPQNIPRPTYSPAVLALAIVCLLWGIVTTYLISLLGAILFILGLAGWIGELRHEH
jgi:hypothetical protein